VSREALVASFRKGACRSIKTNQLGRSLADVPETMPLISRHIDSVTGLLYHRAMLGKMLALPAEKERGLFAVGVSVKRVLSSTRKLGDPR
jgi:hypothetical protein